MFIRSVLTRSTDVEPVITLVICELVPPFPPLTSLPTSLHPFLSSSLPPSLPPSPDVVDLALQASSPHSSPSAINQSLRFLCKALQQAEKVTNEVGVAFDLWKLLNMIMLVVVMILYLGDLMPLFRP